MVALQTTCVLKASTWGNASPACKSSMNMSSSTLPMAHLLMQGLHVGADGCFSKIRQQTLADGLPTCEVHMNIVALSFECSTNLPPAEHFWHFAASGILCLKTGTSAHPLLHHYMLCPKVCFSHHWHMSMQVLCAILYPMWKQADFAS